MIIAENTRPITDYLSKPYVVVNPVNRTGVMGAGVAKWFRDAIPEMYRVYTSHCRQGWDEGNVLLWLGGIDCAYEFQIANVPSKHDWRHSSDLALITKGMQTLNRYALASGKQIVTTKIGCGLGKLSWTTIQPVLEGLEAKVIVATGFLAADSYNPRKGNVGHVMLRHTGVA